MNIALGAFYIKYNINNLLTIRAVNERTSSPFDRFFIWQNKDQPTGPHYILCEPSVTRLGTKFVKMQAFKLVKQQGIPVVSYDVFNALQLLPSEAHFEFVKTLMKPYGED